MSSLDGIASSGIFSGGDRIGQTEFYRVDDRLTKRRRVLDSGHSIDPREPYRYSVAKFRGIAGLVQVSVCDFCRRHGDQY